MRNPLIKHLSTLKSDELSQIYRNVFENDEEGRLVFEDLKARFFEYTPATNMTEVGSENVIKHIKNMLNPLDEEIVNEQPE